MDKLHQKSRCNENIYSLYIKENKKIGFKFLWHTKEYSLIPLAPGVFLKFLLLFSKDFSPYFKLMIF